MHDADQEAMQAHNLTRNVGRTGQVSYLQVLPNLTHTRGSRSFGSRITSPLYSPRYCTTEYSSFIVLENPLQTCYLGQQWKQRSRSLDAGPRGTHSSKQCYKSPPRLGQAQSCPLCQTTEYIFTTTSGWMDTHINIHSSWQTLSNRDPHRQS
jgi:hypothetical protein